MCRAARKRASEGNLGAQNQAQSALDALLARDLGSSRVNVAATRAGAKIYLRRGRFNSECRDAVHVPPSQGPKLDAARTHFGEKGCRQRWQKAATFSRCRPHVVMSPTRYNPLSHSELGLLFSYVAIFLQPWRHHNPPSTRGIMSPSGGWGRFMQGCPISPRRRDRP